MLTRKCIYIYIYLDGRTQHFITNKERHDIDFFKLGYKIDLDDNGQSKV